MLVANIFRKKVCSQQNYFGFAENIRLDEYRMFFVISYINPNNTSYNIYMYKVAPFIVPPDQHKSVLVQVNQIMDGGRYIETLKEESYNGNICFQDFVKYILLRHFY
jgi:hypothetical protein